MCPPESLGQRDFHRSPGPVSAMARAARAGANGSPTASAARSDAGSGEVPSTRAVEWPRTARPLRIAMLGWARLSSQGKEGSGYNLSKSDLARGLVLSGHRVFYLRSGMTYRLPLIGGRGGSRPRVVHREDWAGIRCFELRNAPNVAPSAMNFRNVREEIASPTTTRLVLDWLREVDAEVVHIHSQEGYGLDLIGAIEDSGVPVVVTTHNYWYVCPQVDLLHREVEVCLDYQGGQRCVGCLPGQDVAKYKRQRAWGQTLEYLLGEYPADVVRKAAYGAKPLLRALARGRLVRRHTPPILNPERLPDPELGVGFDIAKAPQSDGTIIHDAVCDRFEQPRDYAKADWGANERVLANREVHLKVLNEYGERRMAGIRALSRASLVTPPSDYLRKVHVTMGVPEERTRWVRLGQPHFDQINRRTRRSPFYATRPWDPRTATTPLRFGFFGTTRPNKGLEVLTRAIPLLDRDVRQRCQFTIRAYGFERGFRKRLSRFPEVCVWPGVGYDLLQLIGSGGDYDVGILPHIWLENSPLVLLENFHAGKFVICSRLGGPVDWVSEGINGLLFAGGDEQALAGCITRLVTGEVPIPSAKAVHEATVLQSYPGHVQELERIYAEVIDRKAGRPSGVAVVAERRTASARA